MSSGLLTHLVRPAVGEPTGMLVLFHGRGADERDLYPLLDVLDPEHRFLGVTPRGPLHLPPGGAHWYAVHEIGYPDPQTFTETFAQATSWLDDLAVETGISSDRIVLGGFSQGAVLTYALGLGDGRPRPAGLIALSGFVPTVPGFRLDLARLAPVHTHDRAPARRPGDAHLGSCREDHEAPRPSTLPSHARTSSRNPGSMLWPISGDSRYTGSAPAPSNMSLARRPHSTEITGSSAPCPIATRGSGSVRSR